MEEKRGGAGKGEDGALSIDMRHGWFKYEKKEGLLWIQET